jgi:hypothetical protein
MEGVFSITQLTSMASVVGAAVGLTWVVKRILGSVRGINCIPVWVYTSVIAGVLAYIANRITGTLPGVTGQLVIDAIVLGAAASGVRSWAQEGLAKPLGASGTAIQAREGTGDGSVRPRGNMGAWLLPLLLVAGTVSVGCAGTVKPPVITGEDQVDARQAATKVLAGFEVAGVVVRDGRQLVSDLAAAGIVTAEVRSQVNQAVIAANDIVQRVITEIASATRLVTVQQLAQQATVGMLSIADILERQTDGRLQTAGRFLRSAVGAIGALIGGAR